MKWKEMSMIQRTIRVIGIVGFIAYLVLGLLSIYEIIQMSEAIHCALFSVVILGIGVAEKSKILRIASYVISAGYLVLALLYCFR